MVITENIKSRCKVAALIIITPLGVVIITIPSNKLKQLVIVLRVVKFKGLNILKEIMLEFQVVEVLQAKIEINHLDPLQVQVRKVQIEEGRITNGTKIEIMIVQILQDLQWVVAVAMQSNQLPNNTDHPKITMIIRIITLTTDITLPHLHTMKEVEGLRGHMREVEVDTTVAIVVVRDIITIIIEAAGEVALMSRIHTEGIIEAVDDTTDPPDMATITRTDLRVQAVTIAEGNVHNQVLNNIIIITLHINRESHTKVAIVITIISILQGIEVEIEKVIKLEELLHTLKDQGTEGDLI